MNTVIDSRSLAFVAAFVIAVPLAWTNAHSATAVRASGVTRTSVNQNVNVNRNTSVNRSASANQNVNVNVNRNINATRNVNVDVDNHHDYHPVAAAVVTAAVVGAVVRTLPPACSAVVVNGITYHNCGGAWYQPQFAGTQVTYVVVHAPR